MLGIIYTPQELEEVIAVLYTEAYHIRNNPDKVHRYKILQAAMAKARKQKKQYEILSNRKPSKYKVDENGSLTTNY